MKTRETKANDLAVLTESLQNSTSAMVMSFTGLTVAKDQEFRNALREAGASYQVVKNTLARIAVKDTPYEGVTEHLKGVTAIAWTENDPVVLTKAVSKFMKDNADIYTFKSGVVDGKVIDLTQLTTIANLPSKEELISKLLFVLNAQAQRIVTVINAVPRDLAVVIKQIGDAKPADTAAVAETAAPAEAEAAAPAEEEAVAEAPAAEVAAEAPAEAVADAPAAEETPVEEAPSEDAPVVEAQIEEAQEEASEEGGGDIEEAAEEAQEKREDDQDPGSPEAEQAEEAKESE
jgi:large subunit ribosomal protein L10